MDLVARQPDQLAGVLAVVIEQPPRSQDVVAVVAGLDGAGSLGPCEHVQKREYVVAAGISGRYLGHNYFAMNIFGMGLLMKLAVNKQIFRVLWKDAYQRQSVSQIQAYLADEPIDPNDFRRALLACNLYPDGADALEDALKAAPTLRAYYKELV